MIGYIEGKYVDMTPTITYVDVNGVGYEVQISLNTYQQINGKKEGKLFTHLHVREDAWTMYGFAELAEKEAFQKLITISGIGAATARVMLSSLTPGELYQIIAAGDNKALEKVKGIGAKTAQRIILELKGKVDLSTVDPKISAFAHNTIEQDALNALMGLGIAKQVAERAIGKVNKEINITVETIIKEALKNL